MKKLLLISTFALLALMGFSQATPSSQVRVATATTDFGINVPIGTTVYCIATDQYFVCKAATASTADLTDASANFTQLATGAAHAAATVTTGTGLGIAGQNITMATANTSTQGTLSAADWNTFNGKQSTSLANGKLLIGNTGGTATAVDMSGDATIVAAGTVTIAAKAVTLAKMNDISTASFIGRNTAATGVPEVLSTATVKTMLGVTASKVEDFEQAVDSITSHTGSYVRYTLAQTPIANTISVQINGVTLKPSGATNAQWTVVSTNKIRVAIPVYMYDQVSVSYSY